MAQDNGIIARESFKSFFLSNGRSVKRVPCTNSETNEHFCMLAIGSKFVGFSSNLGELTDAEINRMKDDLQVVQLEVDPEVAAKRRAEGKQVETYRLCKKGENTWKEVQITGW